MVDNLIQPKKVGTAQSESGADAPVRPAKKKPEGAAARKKTSTQQASYDRSRSRPSPKSLRLLAVRAAVRIKMLTAIPGINCRHAEALICAFDGSLHNLMRASTHALASVSVSRHQTLGGERALAVKRALE